MVERLINERAGFIEEAQSRGNDNSMDHTRYQAQQTEAATIHLSNFLSLCKSIQMELDATCLLAAVPSSGYLHDLSFLTLHRLLCSILLASTIAQQLRVTQLSYIQSTHKSPSSPSAPSSLSLFQNLLAIGGSGLLSLLELPLLFTEVTTSLRSFHRELLSVSGGLKLELDSGNSSSD